MKHAIPGPQREFELYTPGSSLTWSTHFIDLKFRKKIVKLSSKYHLVNHLVKRNVVVEKPKLLKMKLGDKFSPSLPTLTPFSSNLPNGIVLSEDEINDRRPSTEQIS